MSDQSRVSISVRAATVNELERYISMAEGLHRDDSGKRDPFANADWARDHGAQSFQTALRSIDQVVLIAFADNEAVGCLTAGVSDGGAWRPIRVATIWTLYVEPEWRGNRIGEALVDAFLAWGKERGATRVSVAAYSSNDGALRFYQRLGFTPYEVQLERAIG